MQVSRIEGESMRLMMSGVLAVGMAQADRL
jgi:hypothetical protein